MPIKLCESDGEIACLVRFVFQMGFAKEVSYRPTSLMCTSKEPVCPRVELILKIIIILLIIFLGYIKSKPC